MKGVVDKGFNIPGAIAWYFGDLPRGMCVLVVKL